MAKVKRVKTGISGLDEILQGGLISGDSYLIRGEAGSGKTTLGLHFLCAAEGKDKTGLFISLSEPRDKIIRNAEIRNFPVEEKVEILDLSPSSQFVEDGDYTIFPSAEVEQEPLLKAITARIKELKPERVFIDGLTQLRFLSADEHRFRKNIQSLISLMADRETTLMLVSEVGSRPDDDLQFISDGIINLQTRGRERKISVTKLRGSGFKKGSHSYTLDKEGFKVYPVLNPEFSQAVKEAAARDKISSGIPGIDKLLHGGIERGTNTIITGPTGSGKTSLGLTFMKEAAGRGERSVIYLLEESKEALKQRSTAINIPIRDMIKSGNLELISVDRGEINPDIFVHQVKEEVERHDTRLLMLDSITAFYSFFADENWSKSDLAKILDSLRRYLFNHNVTVFMTNEIANITGDFQVTDDQISYLADNLILLRYLELRGGMQKAIGVLKKRLSDFETKLREFQITRYGLEVGAPLENLRGILSGSPEITAAGERNKYTQD